MKKSNNKVICIIQARMNSTRLPGKVLRKISDKPMLWYILNSLQYSKTLDHIVVATTKKIDDLFTKVNSCNYLETKLSSKVNQDIINYFFNNKKNRSSKSSWKEI